MMRSGGVLALVCIATMVALSSTAHRHARSTAACTGGVANIEHFAANSAVIFLGDAVAVGGATNAAPTVTPAPTATAVPATPGASPTPAPPTLGPVTLDLNGIGATFEVIDDYVNAGTPQFTVDDALRGFVERALREEEAGKPHISTCAIDAFVPRFTAGARYLVFAQPHIGTSYYAAAVFRVEEDRIVFNDPGLQYANNGFLYMERATYDRFFAGAVTRDELTEGTVFLDTNSVPLASVLRAVAALRGEPGIAPPETGTAGLLAGR